MQPPSGTVVIALAGAAVLILATRGQLGNAWAALLGGDPHSAVITPAGKVLCHFSATNSDICTETAAQCTAFGGTVRADTQGTCGPAVPESGPGPGAPGSGVTTQ